MSLSPETADRMAAALYEARRTRVPIAPLIDKQAVDTVIRRWRPRRTPQKTVAFSGVSKVKKRSGMAFYTAI